MIAFLTAFFGYLVLVEYIRELKPSKQTPKQKQIDYLNHEISVIDCLLDDKDVELSIQEEEHFQYQRYLLTEEIKKLNV